MFVQYFIKLSPAVLELSL